MSSFALDNLNAYPPLGQATSGSGSSYADGSFGEFGDALQRAAQPAVSEQLSDSASANSTDSATSPSDDSTDSAINDPTGELGNDAFYDAPSSAFSSDGSAVGDATSDVASSAVAPSDLDSPANLSSNSNSPSAGSSASSTIASSNAAQNPSSPNPVDEASQPQQTAGTQEVSASQSGSTVQAEANPRSAGFNPGGKADRTASNPLPATGGVKTPAQATNLAAANAKQGSTTNLLLETSQPLANALPATRTKPNGGTTKADRANGKSTNLTAANVSNASQSGQGSAAITASSPPADPDSTEPDASLASAVATDPSTAVSSVVLVATTGSNPLTAAKSRGAAAPVNQSQPSGGNITAATAVDDAPDNAQAIADADAALAADSAVASAGPAQANGSERPGSTVAHGAKQSADNSTSATADAIAAAAAGAAAVGTAAVGGAAGAAISSLASGSSSSSDDSAAKAGVAPATSTPSAMPGAGVNSPAANLAGGTPTFNIPGATQSSAATGAASSGGASGTSEVDRVRFVQRVARAFQAADEDGGQIRLRLSPPELGSMKLEIAVHGGTMTAHVETETSAARNMLLDNLPALRQRLADQNIKIGQFDVDLKDQSGGAASGSGFTDPRNQSPLYAPRTNSVTATDPGAASSSQVSSLLGGSGELNVVV